MNIIVYLFCVPPLFHSGYLTAAFKSYKNMIKIINFFYVGVRA